LKRRSLIIKHFIMQVLIKKKNMFQIF